MEFTYADKNQWPEIKKIYLEAFPKAERKPYLSLRHSVKKGKALLMTASENNQLLFITGTSGEMEILNYGGRVSQEEYLSLQKYALGSLFFKLSHIRIIHETSSQC